MRTLQRLWFSELIWIFLSTTALLQHHATAAEPTKETPYVTTADTQLRKGPGTKYDVIQIIPRDFKISVVGKEGSWLKVQSKHGKEPGYIDEQYARPTAMTKSNTPSGPGAYVTTGEVNLREGPGTKYKVLRKIPKDTKINVIRIDGNWLRVESKKGNPSGYIDKRFAQKMP